MVERRKPCAVRRAAGETERPARSHVFPQHSPKHSSLSQVTSSSTFRIITALSPSSALEESSSSRCDPNPSIPPPAQPPAHHSARGSDSGAGRGRGGGEAGRGERSRRAGESKRGGPGTDCQWGRAKGRDAARQARAGEEGRGGTGGGVRSGSAEASEAGQWRGARWDRGMERGTGGRRAEEGRRGRGPAGGEEATRAWGEEATRERAGEGGGRGEAGRGEIS